MRGVCSVFVFVFAIGFGIGFAFKFRCKFGFGFGFEFVVGFVFLTFAGPDVDGLELRILVDVDGLWGFDLRLGNGSKGTSGSRKLSRVGLGLNRGIAAPYVIYINSSAGNITYIPCGPLDSFRRASD